MNARKAEGGFLGQFMLGVGCFALVGALLVGVQWVINFTQFQSAEYGSDRAQIMLDSLSVLALWFILLAAGGSVGIWVSKRLGVE